MDSPTRVRIALKGKQPDRIPIFESIKNEASITNIAQELDLINNNKSQKKTMGFGATDKKILELYCRIIEELGIDSTCWNFSIGLKPSADEAVDKYGRKYRLSEHGAPIVIEGPIKKAADIESFSMAEKLTKSDFNSFEYIVTRLGGQNAHFITIPDPFTAGWYLRGGMAKFFMDLKKNKDLVRKILETVLEYNLKAISLAREINPDLFVFLSGDLSGESGTLISPKDYRKFVKPLHKEIVNYCHQKGVEILKHSDGNVWPILADFVDVGFDGFHPVQPQCMDIKQVKDFLKDSMCVVGNIDCRDLLVSGTLQEVRSSVKETIKLAAPKGGYMISSSNSIHPAVNPKNYIEMINTAKNYGNY